MTTNKTNENIKFDDDHKHVNQSSDSRVRKSKKDRSFLPQYRLQVYGVHSQLPDAHGMSVDGAQNAGTQKKRPRFTEIPVVPGGKPVILKSVFSLSTLTAISTDIAESTQKTSEIMGGTTTASPLLFMNNLQKLLAEANKNNPKKRSLSASTSGLENNVHGEVHNKRRGHTH